MSEKVWWQDGETPRDAAKGKEIVFVCVRNDNDLRSVVLGDKGALAGMSRGTILVDNTTASANAARERHRSAREAGAGFIDAHFPVVKPERRTVH